MTKDPLSLERFLNTDILSDVCFRIEAWKSNHKIVESKIRAHKLILVAGSPVFETMFLGSLPETRDEIVINDIDSKTFLTMLRYLYTKQLNNNTIELENVLDVWYAANKYEIGPLEEHCWSIIDTQSERFFQMDKFLSIKPFLLEKILSRDSLDIDELTLFQHVRRWTLEQCRRQKLEPNYHNQKTILDTGLLRLIRFPLISKIDFLKYVVPSNILSDEDLSTINHYYENIQKLSSYPNLPFTDRPRSWHGQEFCLNFYRFKSPLTITNKQDFSLRFKPNQTITITGLNIWGHCISANEQKNVENQIHRSLSIMIILQISKFTSIKDGKKEKYCPSKDIGKSFKFELQEEILNQLELPEHFQINAEHVCKIIIQVHSPAEAFFRGSCLTEEPSILVGNHHRKVRFHLMKTKKHFSPLKSILFCLGESYIN